MTQIIIIVNINHYSDEDVTGNFFYFYPLSQNHMHSYSIEGRKGSPNIFISADDQLVEIRGRSTLKDTNWFYSNLLKWVLAFNIGSRRTETINIRFELMNDSTTKWLLLIFKKLEQLLPTNKFEINWYFQKSGGRIERIGQRIKNELNSNVNLLAI